MVHCLPEKNWQSLGCLKPHFAKIGRSCPKLRDDCRFVNCACVSDVVPSQLGFTSYFQKTNKPKAFIALHLQLDTKAVSICKILVLIQFCDQFINAIFQLLIFAFLGRLPKVDLIV